MDQPFDMIRLASQRPINPLKSWLLVPFSARHRAKLRISRQPPAVQRIVHQLVVSDDERLLFTRNFKAGCSSASHLIYEYSKGRKYRDNISHAEDLARGIPYWKKIERCLGSPDCYRFTIVREPVARAVSGFRDFVVEGRNGKAPLYAATLAALGLCRDDPLERQFDVYLTFLELFLAQDRLGADPHFRTQAVNIGLGVVDYQRICRLEDYIRDMRQVFDEAGVAPPADALGGERRNRSSRQSAFTPDAGQVRRQQALYAEDFEAFGY